MADRSILAHERVNWRALIACLLVIILPVALAGWLNAISVFAFPLGTFLTALCVPIGLTAIVAAVQRETGEESDRE